MDTCSLLGVGFPRPGAVDLARFARLTQVGKSAGDYSNLVSERHLPISYESSYPADSQLYKKQKKVTGRTGTVPGTFGVEKKA